MATPTRPRAVVLGQIGRDLVLVLDELPPGGGAAPVRERHEWLGGKGANQALACRQLGADAALIGAVADDDAGQAALEQAQHDGLDVTGVVRRSNARTALLIDVVAPPGTRRLLEDIGPDVTLTPADVAAVHGLIAGADVMVLQLQQPADALLAAIEVVEGTDVLLVADGAPPDEQVREALLRAGAVLRADQREAALLTGRELAGAPDTLVAAEDLVRRGARAVALSAGADGDVVAWSGGHVVTPLLGEHPVDPTGAGDAATAALAVALSTGESPERAAWWAAAAAAHSVVQAGGRARLDAREVRRAAEEAESASVASLRRRS
ncbi:carbohydrate kinase [Aeromicrobium phragmitis]|uniref:Carbohydrate kinase n=1 Tax=Aeromicrobium phragmitis TaxID=2478914 RepID=A0A3L8PJW7_9ACTN|nr:PfkB family carbohydrate kinase [Aeromicrobium phragmitis]RLV55520.1 carbohydrate kinase [Aeromicrobium phragmitis]